MSDIELPDYYSVGTVQNPVMSNSAASHLNPEEGGCPQKFLDFFNQDIERETSKSMERGSRVHLWHEDQSSFLISDLEKPSPMVATWAEKIFKVLKPTGGMEAFNSDLVLSLGNDYYRNVKDPVKRVAKFHDERGFDYLKTLFEGDGKIILTSSDKAVVEGCIAALETNEKTNLWLFSPVKDGQERYKELDIYFHLEVGGINLPCKARIDNVIFDFNKKVFYLNDLKTSSKPISLFKSSFKSFRYYRQMAFYVRAIYEFLKQNGHDEREWKPSVRICGVDYTPYFNADVFIIDPNWIAIGKREMSSILERFAWHLSNNIWDKTPEFAKKTIINYTAKDEILMGD